MEDLTIVPATDTERILAMAPAELAALDVEDVDIPSARRRFEELSAEHARRSESLAGLGEEIHALWDELGVPDATRDAWFAAYADNPLSEATLTGVSRDRDALVKRKAKELVLDLRKRCQRLLAVGSGSGSGDSAGGGGSSNGAEGGAAADEDSAHTKAVAAHFMTGALQEELSAIAATDDEAVTWEEALALREKVELHEATGNGISLILQTIARREKLVKIRHDLLNNHNDPKRLVGKAAFKELQVAERKEKLIKTELELDGRPAQALGGVRDALRRAVRTQESEQRWQRRRQQRCSGNGDGRAVSPAAGGVRGQVRGGARVASEGEARLSLPRPQGALRRVQAQRRCCPRRRAESRVVAAAAAAE